MTSQPSADRPSLFIVETDDVDVLTLERIVQRARVANRYRFLSVSNALDQLRTLRLQGERTCLVLGTSSRGVELDLLRQLRASNDLKALPVVIAVLDAEEIMRIEDLGLAVAGYVMKPISHEALAHALRQIGLPLDYA